MALGDLDGRVPLGELVPGEGDVLLAEAGLGKRRACAGGIQLRVGLTLGGGGVVEGLSASRRRLEQLLRPLPGDAGVGDRRLPLGDKRLGLRDLLRPVAGFQLVVIRRHLIALGARLRERVLEVDLLQRRQRLTGFDHVALVHIQLFDAARRP